MTRRWLCLLAGVLCLAAAGCQYALKNDGSYRDLSEHAMRLDDEFHNFHADVRAIFFGLDEPSETVYRRLYGD